MITRLPGIVDDIGDKISGTAITKNWWGTVEDMIDARWSIININSTGVVNNLNVGEADLVIFNNAAPLTLTGILTPANPAKPGKPIRLFAGTPNPVYLAYLDGRSSGANVFYNRVSSGPTPIVNGGAAMFVHNGGAWVLLHHDQGGWIAATLTAAMFTATVGTFVPNIAGSAIRYLLSNKHLHLNFGIAGGAVSNITGNLFAALPGYTNIAVQAFQPARVVDNGVPGWGMLQPSANRLAFWSNVGGAGFAVSAGATTLDGAATIEVQ